MRSGDGSNSARLQARITEEWEGEARDQEDQGLLPVL